MAGSCFQGNNPFWSNKRLEGFFDSVIELVLLLREKGVGPDKHVHRVLDEHNSCVMDKINVLIDKVRGLTACKDIEALL